MISVEESLDDFGKPRFVIKTDKFKSDFIVKKSNNGFSFFEVAVSKGKVPKELEGSYSTAYIALDAVKHYVKKSKPSASVRRDKNYEENH